MQNEQSEISSNKISASMLVKKRINPTTLLSKASENASSSTSNNVSKISGATSIPSVNPNSDLFLKPTTLLSKASENASSSTSNNVSKISGATSIPSVNPNSDLFLKFLIECKKNNNSHDMDKIMFKLSKAYNQASQTYKESPDFRKLLSNQLEASKHKTMKTFHAIKLVRDELRYNKKVVRKQPVKEESKSSGNYTSSINPTVLEQASTSTDVNPADNAEDNEDSDADSLVGFDIGRKRKIKKFEKVLRALNKAIKKLEEREVDWDKEENSSYLRLDRYRARFNYVYEKMCALRNKSSDADRPVKRNVTFTGYHQDICKCVEKLYNRTKKFPDFQDILVIVKEVKKKENFNSEELHKIAIEVFKEFGTLLKIRRQRDDYDIMCSYLPGQPDPALSDPDLNRKLTENLAYFKKKEEEIIENFAEKAAKIRLKPEEVKDDASTDGEDDDSEEEEEEEKEKQYEELLMRMDDNSDDSEFSDSFEVKKDKQQKKSFIVSDDKSDSSRSSVSQKRKYSENIIDECTSEKQAKVLEVDSDETDFETEEDNKCKKYKMSDSNIDDRLKDDCHNDNKSENDSDSLLSSLNLKPTKNNDVCNLQQDLNGEFSEKPHDSGSVRVPSSSDSCIIIDDDDDSETLKQSSCIKKIKLEKCSDSNKINQSSKEISKENNHSVYTQDIRNNISDYSNVDEKELDKKNNCSALRNLLMSDTEKFEARNLNKERSSYLKSNGINSITVNNEIGKKNNEKDLNELKDKISNKMIVNKSEEKVGVNYRKDTDDYHSKSINKNEIFESIILKDVDKSKKLVNNNDVNKMDFGKLMKVNKLIDSKENVMKKSFNNENIASDCRELITDELKKDLKSKIHLYTNISEDEIYVIENISKNSKKPPYTDCPNQKSMEETDGDIDVIYDGTSADEVRIITPRKKLKTIPQPEPDVSVINVKNKLEEDLNKMGKEFPVYHEGKIAVCEHFGFLSPSLDQCLRCKYKFPPDIKSIDIQASSVSNLDNNFPTTQHTIGRSKMIPLSTSTPNNKHFKLTLTHLLNSNSDEDNKCPQTARVIFDGNKAEFVNKSSAKRVLNMGHTKVFTKGVKSSKNTNNGEVLTLTLD
ncbi:uncharacterized protein LOC142327257 isoform X2 [Lycorma delicatula]